MEVTNSSVTAKHVRSAVFNGWSIQYSFETDNSILVGNAIKASAAKGNTTITQTTGDNLNQIVAINGQNDYTLAAAIDAVFDSIKIEFAPIVEQAKG